MVWINIDLVEKVHRKAKSISATRGQTLKVYLAELIRVGVGTEDGGE